MKVSLNELQKAAEEFIKASDETDAILEHLQKTVKKLEENWEDANQEVFYSFYSEWNAQISGISFLLKLSAQELNAIAERYAVADGLVDVKEHTL